MNLAVFDFAWVYLMLLLETAYNIRIPGFGGDDLRSVRKTSVPATHQQKLNHVRKAMLADMAEKDKERIGGVSMVGKR
jgi:transcription initiation factor TFIID subunit TAF12